MMKKLFFLIITLTLYSLHVSAQQPKSLVCQTLQKFTQMILEAPDKEQALNDVLSKLPENLKEALKYLVNADNNLAQAVILMVWNNLISEAEFFNNCGIDINIAKEIAGELTSNTKTRILYKAIENNQYEKVKLILELSHLDVNISHAMHAIEYDMPGILSLLIKKGIDINDNDGTLLLIAIQKIKNLKPNDSDAKKQNTLTILKTVLNLGANPNIKSKFLYNQSFLDLLILNLNNPNNDIIYQARKMLIQAGAKSYKQLNL